MECRALRLLHVLHSNKPQIERNNISLLLSVLLYRPSTGLYSSLCQIQYEFPTNCFLDVFQPSLGD